MDVNHPHLEGKRPYVLFPPSEQAAALQALRALGIRAVGSEWGSRTQRSPSAGLEGPGPCRAQSMAGFGHLPNKQSPQISDTPGQPIRCCASPRTSPYVGFSLENVMASRARSFPGAFPPAGHRRKHVYYVV